MRHPDWALQLSNTIKAASERPFSWGEFDCCIFAADCAVAVCGVDPAEAYRGKYKTETSAKRVVAKGHGSVEAILDAYFNRVNPAFAQRGDLATYQGANGLGVAVRWANEYWTPCETGVARIDCEPLAVWRVE